MGTPQARKLGTEVAGRGRQQGLCEQALPPDRAVYTTGAMKTLIDSSQTLASGLSEIRAQFRVPEGFPPEIEAAAKMATKRVPDDHADRTAVPFVTLDPASSTDLDQAFSIERSGADIILHYAIADVAWFVRDGDALDEEAWRRGTTLYLPDGKARLYPKALSENAASLLPGGPRPAVIFSVRVGPDGSARLDAAERAMIHSRAKLAYETVKDGDLPDGFSELANRMAQAEAARGASRVDPPEQEVEHVGNGAFQLAFRPKLKSEEQNAALSLAANMAIAQALYENRTGLFRVMSEADAEDVAKLRNAAKALGLAWPAGVSLESYQRGLDAADPKQAAFMLAIRRASRGATYVPYEDGKTPWHAAMAATYAHATAPLRRLADRYVVRATLAVANGKPVPDVVSEAFEKLPKVMARADGQASQINRAVIDLAEVVMLDGRENEIFPAVVTDRDARGVRVQLCALPVVATVDANGVQPGDGIDLKLVSAEPDERRIVFEPVRAG